MNGEQKTAIFKNSNCVLFKLAACWKLSQFPKGEENKWRLENQIFQKCELSFTNIDKYKITNK